jgi:hemoglobin
MRHAPYRIGERERDHWLMHMVAAVEASDAGDDERQELLAYFVTAAEHLRNDDSMRLVDPGP